MAKDKALCPDCGGRTTQGFVLDVTHGGRLAARWLAGKPVRSFWTGVKLEGHECRQIESWRCGDCGLLREYATTPVAPAAGLFG